MKLEKTLSHLNSFEKNSFLKIIDNIIAHNPKNAIEIDKILSDKSRDLKNVDNINVAHVFNLVENEFVEYLKKEFVDYTSQFDIVVDIITRDGNCVMKQDWFARLYEHEITKIENKIQKFKAALDDDSSDIDEQRKRDYKIYQTCLNTAYHNDEENNQEAKITTDELSILLTLSQQLQISQVEKLEVMKLRINFLEEY